MPNIFYYVATIVLLYTMSFDVDAGMVEDMEAQGEVKAVAPCVVKREALTCIVLEWKGSTYSVAGLVKDGDFYARYIGKLVGESWVIVWVYGTEI